MCRLYICLITVLLSSQAYSSNTAVSTVQKLTGTITVPFDDFSLWHKRSFKGETNYQSFQLPAKEDTSGIVENSGFPTRRTMAVYASSHNSASGMLYEKEIDLQKTPWLSWAWSAKRFPSVKDEKVKAGDDFALRVSVIAQTGFTMFSSKTITYVWSQSLPEGTIWPNPFAPGKVMMLAASSGPGSGWKQIERNVKADFEKAYGKTIHRIEAIAIMTDSDNSGSYAEGYYSQPVFSSVPLYH